MLSKNQRKNKKFKFEESDFDFKWDSHAENSAKTNEDHYGNILRNNYRYNPSLHEFDTDRFKVPEK